MLLRPKYETFCQSYAANASAAEAARTAGYGYENAANQAFRLLQRPDIQARLAELAAEQADIDAAWDAKRAARRAQLAAMRATEAETLLAKLDPIYEDRLDAGDHAAVMKVVALQARIAGLLEDETKPRAGRAKRGAGTRSDELDLG